MAPPPDPVVRFISGPLTASESDVELEVAVIIEKLEGIPLNLTFIFEPAEEQGRARSIASVDSNKSLLGILLPWFKVHGSLGNYFDRLQAVHVSIIPCDDPMT